VSVKTAVARYEGTGLRFRVSTGSGHELVLDNKEGNAGPRPAEMVAVGQAGCTAMDVISILRKKRQVVTRYEVSVESEQRDDPPPSIFTCSITVHTVEGPAIDEAAVRRAIELSATKYCSVAATLSTGSVEIHHRYRIVSPEGAAPVEGEVVVTGPYADPDRLGQGAGTAGAA
jgi:putative redox protein